jgi:hypothetical protein
MPRPRRTDPPAKIIKLLSARQECVRSCSPDGVKLLGYVPLCTYVLSPPFTLLLPHTTRRSTCTRSVMRAHNEWKYEEAANIWWSATYSPQIMLSPVSQPGGRRRFQHKDQQATAVDSLGARAGNQPQRSAIKQ